MYMKIFSHIYKNLIFRIVSCLVILTGMVSCEDYLSWTKVKVNDVFIIYSIGYNNLSYYLKRDIDEVIANYSSIQGRDKEVIIFTHSKGKYGYATPNPPSLIRLSKNRKGEQLQDTLFTMPTHTVSASPETMNEVLSYVKDMYPEAKFSILFSSHGTGWTPTDYCNDPDKYEGTSSDSPWSMMRAAGTVPKEYWGVSENGMPAVKSFGIQNITTGSYYEMDICEMAASFPMKMETIIFDACFMGGVEVAYEFRNNADYIIASQTEIIADGMDYRTILSYIFAGIDKKQSLSDFCENYYNYYNRQYSVNQSATISLIDCSKLEALAEACKDVFNSQRSEIAALNPANIQKYYRAEYESIHRWFHDMGDIVLKSGLSQEQKEIFNNALNDCVIYKAATERFMDVIRINSHSGLSMYLPFEECAYLNNYYKTLGWNKATELVK